MTKSRRRLFILGTALASTALALIAAEFAVRLFLPYNSPETIGAYSLRYEPTIFARYRMRGENRLVEIDQQKAWGSKSADEPPDRAYYINERGYRGPGFAVPKPERTTRVIVLGGSAVFDLYVSDSESHRGESWPNLVERILRERGHAEVEVINAGVPGYASFDSLGRLYSQLWMYEPDFVVVYHGWNDLKYWKRYALSPATPLIDRVEPHDPSDNPFLSYRGAGDRLLCHSQLYVKLRSAYFQRKIDVGLEGAVPRPDSSAADGETPRWNSYGPRQFGLDLKLITDASRSIGAVPVLVTQATLVSPDTPDEDRGRIAHEYQKLDYDELVDAFTESYRIIRDLSQTANVPLIDAAAVINGRQELFVDAVHTTQAGSRALAEVLADGLEPLLVREDRR